MCGRFALGRAPREIAQLFQLEDPPDILAPRFNVAPSQMIPVIEREAGTASNKLLLMSWGLVPRWAKSPKEGPRPINARSETIRKSAPFRASSKDRVREPWTKAHGSIYQTGLRL